MNSISNRRNLLIFLAFTLAMGCSMPEDPSEEKMPFTYWGYRYLLTSDVAYGTDSEQKLDIYRQGRRLGELEWWRNDSSSHPTLIFIHGGGWVGGKKETDITSITPYLQHGWNVVNLEYRKGENTAPAAVEDVLCALEWIADHAEEYNLDMDRVVLSGGSAGGHLSLIASFLNTKEKGPYCHAGDRMNIRAVVNWFGITDIEKIETYLRNIKPDWNYASMWIDGTEKVDSISKMYSPVHHISEGTPPVLTLHGELDSVVLFDQATELHRLLDSAGVPNRLLSDPMGNHGGFSNKQYQVFYEAIFEFLGPLTEA